MSKIIMHIDLNAFFARAEELRDPSLEGKPMIVGGLGRRGVVSTASYSARKYGIHSGMPTFQATQLCPGLIVKGCDFAYYEMLSNSFFAYVKRFTPLIEVASIDECYADMTKPLSKEKDPTGYLLSLQKGLFDEIGLKCSIGLGPIKFLAKMASDMKKPMGLTILRRKDIPALLYPLPIESFFGIGKKTSPRLREIGIKTIGDLHDMAEKDDERLKRLLGKGFESVKMLTRGYGDDHVEVEPFDPKSIGHSETFSHDTNDIEEIREKIRALAYRTSAGAKREKKQGKTIQLVIKDTDFKSHDKSRSIPEPTNDPDAIADVALSLYEKNFQGLLIRLVGVTLQNLIDPKEETVQMSLWNFPSYEKMDKTKLLVNEMNRKLKKPSLMVASEVKKDGH